MKPRLLVIEMHHLGDAVMALPFLRATSCRYETVVFCRPGVAEFLCSAAPKCQIVPCSGWRDVFRRLPKLGSGDTAVCAWPDTRAHLAMKWSGAGIRIGFRIAEQNFYGAARPWRRRRLLAGRFATSVLSLMKPLLTSSLDRPAQGQTHGGNWSQISRAIDCEPDFSFPWLPVPQAPLEFRAFIKSSREAGMRIVALHPGGRLPGKRWPQEHFQTLLGYWFPRRNIAVAIVKPPGEDCPHPLVPSQRIFESPDPVSLAAILAGVDGVLCNDSFASHLAAAVGVPVVTIFGSGDPAWFAPHGNEDLVVASDACPFRPCVDRCVQPSYLCLENTSIRLVEEKLSAMLPDLLEKPNIETIVTSPAPYTGSNPDT